MQRWMYDSAILCARQPPLVQLAASDLGSGGILLLQCGRRRMPKKTLPNWFDSQRLSCFTLEATRICPKSPGKSLDGGWIALETARQCIWCVSFVEPRKVLNRGWISGPAMTRKIYFIRWGYLDLAALNSCKAQYSTTSVSVSVRITISVSQQESTSPTWKGFRGFGCFSGACFVSDSLTTLLSILLLCRASQCEESWVYGDSRPRLRRSFGQESSYLQCRVLSQPM